MNYWYYSRGNEIFLDLDNSKSISRAFNVLSKTDLQIRDIFIFPTYTPKHIHLVVVLEHYYSIQTRLAWSLWMANDRLRVAYVMQRSWLYGNDLFKGDLLMGSRKYHREPDSVCFCKEKHKAAAVTSRCPAMKMLIGEAASADYFTRTGRIGLRPVDPILFPWGRVDLEKLKHWGESDGKNFLRHPKANRGLSKSNARRGADKHD